jgi:very-short-patch-repair endonuclease
VPLAPILWRRRNRHRVATVHFRVDLHLPFRGSVAVAAGVLTQAVLHGPRFRRLFPDVYLHADVELDLAMRSLAAAALTGDRGVLGGYSAAELLGASCGPLDAPAEVIVPGRRRAPPGLVVRVEDVPPGERWCARGAAITSPVRTALDLACRGSLVEAVVGVDALGHRFGLSLRDVVRCAYDHSGKRGLTRLPRVIRLANPLAESPMETRIRLAIVLACLPAPLLQVPVGPFRLDMGYPELMLGVEHDGREHLDPRRALRDLDRQAYFTAAGWRILRFPKQVVLHDPARIPWTVRRAMIAASGTSQRSRAS